MCIAINFDIYYRHQLNITANCNKIGIPVVKKNSCELIQLVPKQILYYKGHFLSPL